MYFVKLIFTFNNKYRLKHSENCFLSQYKIYIFSVCTFVCVVVNIFTVGQFVFLSVYLFVQYCATMDSLSLSLLLGLSVCPFFCCIFVYFSVSLFPLNIVGVEEFNILPSFQTAQTMVLILDGRQLRPWYLY